MLAADWWNDTWPLRCRVRLPNGVAAQTADYRLSVRLQLNFQADLADLGISGHVIPESIRVVRSDPQTDACGPDAKPLRIALEPDALVWEMPGDSPPGTSLSFHVYFDVAELDTSIPPFIRRNARTWERVPASTLASPDYARDTYGKAWDFDHGDFEGIDSWGNRPEYVRNRQVKNGVLSMDVKEDPYFIWGDMWSSGQKTHRKVAIDLKKYPILKMRIRQSCPSAEWKLYGRAGSPSLMEYKFRVTGTGWQIVRVDLVEEARWGDVLDAFRINTTYGVADAHVEIDWISLTNEILAVREPVEVLGRPSGLVQRVVVEPERLRVECGSHQAITLRAVDRGGPRPRAASHRASAPTGDGLLSARPPYRTLALGPSARRGLTDAQGRLQVGLTSSGRVGREAETLEAVADFASVKSERLAIETYAGAPHHYELSPSQAVCLSMSRFPLPLQVQLVDEHGNPVAVANRKITLTGPPEATVAPAEIITDSNGMAAATLRVNPAPLGLCDPSPRHTRPFGRFGEDYGCSARWSPQLDPAFAQRLLRHGRRPAVCSVGRILCQLGATGDGRRRVGQAEFVHGHQ